jgi:hypothetical protein
MPLGSHRVTHLPHVFSHCESFGLNTYCSLQQWARTAISSTLKWWKAELTHFAPGNRKQYLVGHSGEQFVVIVTNFDIRIVGGSQVIFVAHLVRRYCFAAEVKSSGLMILLLVIALCLCHNHKQHLTDMVRCAIQRD